MLKEEVTNVEEYGGDDRCEHNYGGIWEQCSNTASHLVTVQNDMGELDLKLCGEHKDKLN